MPPRPLRSLCLALLAGCLPSTEVQTLLVTAAATPGASLTVEATWLGEDRQLELRNDGAPPDREAGDGIYSASLSGRPARVLPLRLRSEGELVFEGNLVMYLGDNEVHLAPDPSPQRYSRVARAGTLSSNRAARYAQLAAWFAWACVVGGLVMRLARSGGAGPRDPQRWPAWASPLTWLALAAAWTWPAIAAGREALPGRYYDALGTVWSISSASRLLPDLHDQLTGWPGGTDYTRFDSFLLLPMAMALDWLHPIRAYGLLQVLGVAASGWAAEGCARALGARAPWSLLAGLGFAFSGIAARVLLEGPVYLICDPWLPLFVWAWWRVLQVDAQPRHGVAAALALTGALLTSGYLGLCAALLGLAMWAFTWRQPRPSKPMIAAAMVFVPVGIAYTALFMADSGGRAPEDRQAFAASSAHLSSLAGPTAETDAFEHALSFSASPVMMALFMLAPVILPRRSNYRALAFAAALGLLAAMLPAALMSGANPLRGALLGWLSGTGIADVISFPGRLTWIAWLCIALVAALVASRIAGRVGRWGWLLIVLALLDVFALPGLASRQRSQVGQSPSAYQQAAGPVFDLFPEGQWIFGERDMWNTATACLYQVDHGQPIAEDCVSTSGEHHPRNAIARALVWRLLEGDGAGAAGWMSGAGFEAIAFHPDLFRPGDRARLEPGLRAMDPDPTESTDGGEHIQIFQVPAQGADEAPVAARSLGLAAQGQAGSGLRLALLVPPDEARTFHLRIHAGDELIEGDLGGGGANGGRSFVVQKATLSTALPAEIELELFPSGEEGGGWSGPVHIRGDGDTLTFRLLDGQIVPVTAGPIVSTPAPDPGLELVALVGWVAFFGVCLVLYPRR